MNREDVEALHNFLLAVALAANGRGMGTMFSPRYGWIDDLELLTYEALAITQEQMALEAEAENG